MTYSMAVKGFILQSHSYGAGSRDFTFLSDYSIVEWVKFNEL